MPLEQAPLMLRLALELALREDDEPLDPPTLFERLWSHPRYDPRARRQVVHTAIRRLRSLLRPHDEPHPNRSPIGHERGRGYRFTPAPDLLVIATAAERLRAELPTDARAILTLLDEQGPLATREIARLRNRSAQAVRRVLHRLCAQGLAAREGTGRATRYRATPPH